VEESDLLARRVSSSVFNPSGEVQRASSNKNLNGARSAQDLYPPHASSSVKRLVDIQLYAPPPQPREPELDSYHPPTYQRQEKQQQEDDYPPTYNDDLQRSDSQRNNHAYEVDVGCEEEMEDEQNEYRRAGSRYSQPGDAEEAEGEDEDEGDGQEEMDQ
jgi:hypothetical protein